MVVRHDDVDPGEPGGRDLRAAGAARIDGDHEPAPGGAGQLHGAQGKAVAVVQPARHMRRCVDPERSQSADHDRQPRQAVGIEVAHDEDALRGFTRACDALHRAVRIRQARGVVQRVQRRPEEVIHLVRADPARGHDAGQARRAPVGAHGSHEPIVERRPIRVDPVEPRLDHETQDDTDGLSGPLCGRARRAGETTPPGRITSPRGGPVGRSQRPGGAPPTPPRQ